jgi:hypothetical protein
VHFDIVRRDGAGTRLLFATSTPFQPVRSRIGPFPILREPVVVLQGFDIPVGKEEKDGAALDGTMRLPLAPAFAEEAS